jgi:hypothetical protein
VCERVAGIFRVLIVNPVVGEGNNNYSSTNLTEMYTTTKARAYVVVDGDWIR